MKDGETVVVFRSFQNALEREIFHSILFTKATWMVMATQIRDNDVWKLFQDLKTQRENGNHVWFKMLRMKFLENSKVNEFQQRIEDEVDGDRIQIPSNDFSLPTPAPTSAIS
jgi:hypothetical protein